MRYHRINRNASMQENDELFKYPQDREEKITIIIPFTNLDVLVDTNTTTTKEVVLSEIVLCFVKPQICLFIKKRIQHRFPDNTLID